MNAEELLAKLLEQHRTNHKCVGGKVLSETIIELWWQAPGLELPPAFQVIEGISVISIHKSMGVW